MNTTKGEECCETASCLQDRKWPDSLKVKEYLENGCASGGDSDWDSEDKPQGERWPPLGAPTDDEDKDSLCSYSEYGWYGSRFSGEGSNMDKLKELEDEQEQLSSSLMSLTSHFAQVQFRLRQILQSGPEEKEKLLLELEEFANRGIPDASKIKHISESNKYIDNESSSCMMNLEMQKELIDKLKQQLEDLENFAYLTGDADVPQSVMLQKQRVVIDQLREKLNMTIEDFDKLSIDDLKSQVDSALFKIINPIKMKEQLIFQLQTQVVDLERFIHFLQGEKRYAVSESTSNCKCDGHETSKLPSSKTLYQSSKTKPVHFHKGGISQTKIDENGIFDKIQALLGMLVFAHLGCGTERQRFHRNTLKKSSQGNHWGFLSSDLRANFEVAVEILLQLMSSVEGGTSSDSDSVFSKETNEVTIVVRKQLVPALRDLMQHGLVMMGSSQSLVPFLACLPVHSHKTGKMMHAWDLLLNFYEMKRGDVYNKAPARKLSQSFNLKLSGEKNNKESLLCAIGNIKMSHGPLKRSYDSQFKAFVSEGLNQKKLVIWLRLVFRCQSLMESCFQPWSYAAQTGFEDALRSLDRLTGYYFNLPVNLAIKSFQEMKDAF